MHKAKGEAEKKEKNYICKHPGTFLTTRWCQIHISEHLLLRTNPYSPLPQWSLSYKKGKLVLVEKIKGTMWDIERVGEKLVKADVRFRTCRFPFNYE